MTVEFPVASLAPVEYPVASLAPAEFPVASLAPAEFPVAPPPTEFGARVCALIAEHTNLPVESVTPELAFDDLPLDSLGMLELLLLAETAFGVVALDDDGVEVHTVGDAIDFLASKLPDTE